MRNPLPTILLCLPVALAAITKTTTLTSTSTVYITHSSSSSIVIETSAIPIIETSAEIVATTTTTSCSTTSTSASSTSTFSPTSIPIILSTYISPSSSPSSFLTVPSNSNGTISLAPTAPSAPFPSAAPSASGAPFVPASPPKPKPFTGAAMKKNTGTAIGGLVAAGLVIWRLC